MRNYILKFVLLLLLSLLFSCTAMIAQTITQAGAFDPGTTAQDVFNWYTALYGAVITAITYIQGAFFKKSTWLPNVAVRYILIAIVAGALFISLGWVNALQVFIGFIGAAITYDKVLSPLGLKTQRPGAS